MKPYRYLFFDMDGTLTDSAPGILGGARYALGEMGQPVEEDPSYYRFFIGPPLHDSFARYFEGEMIDEAVRVYRVYYEKQGKFENRVYDGVYEMLDRLAEAGYILAVATSKHRYFTAQILDHFDLTRRFRFISAADDEVLKTKADVIRHALETLGASPDQVLMIGDRHHDLEGASACGVDSVGVTYGYAEPHELDAATYLAASPQGILRLLL